MRVAPERFPKPPIRRQKVLVTCSPKSAQNRVRFSYSGVRAEHVEEQAYGGADDRCAEAGGGGPEGGRRSPGVRSVQAHPLCLEGEVRRDGRDRGAGSQVRGESL